MTNNMKEKITVIIPLHNSKKYLNRLLDSLEHQTYQNFEVLFIENGSNDGSEKIIKEQNKSNYIYYYLESGNVSAARNYGINIAKGKYIFFMDSDDTIERNCLEICMDQIYNKKVDLVMFGFNKILNNKKESDELLFNNTILEHNEIVNKIIRPMIYAQNREKLIMGSVWRIFTKIEYIKKVKFDEEVSIAEDLLYCIELFNYINSIYILDQKLYNYYFNTESALNRVKYDSLNRSIIYNEKLKNKLNKLGLFDKDMEKRFYMRKGRMYTIAVSEWCREKNKEKSIKTIKEIAKEYSIDSNKNNYCKYSYSITTKLALYFLEKKFIYLIYYTFYFKEKIRLKKQTL